MKLARLASLFLAAPAASAQLDVRPLQPLTSAPSTVVPLVATEADHAVVLVHDGDLALRTSDGRGVEWSAPMPLGAPNHQVPGDARRLVLVDGTAFAMWSEMRVSSVPAPFAAREVKLRALDVESGALGASLAMPSVGAADMTEVRLADLDVERVGSAFHVFAVTTETVADAGGQVIGKASYLHASHDGGATWLTPQVLPDSNGAFVDDLQLEAEGSSVHIAWGESNGLNAQLIYARSLNGGLSLQPRMVLDSSLAVKLDFMRVKGATVALLAHLTDDLLSSSPNLYTSRNGGTKFGQFHVLGEKLTLANGPAGATALEVLDDGRTIVATGIRGGQFGTNPRFIREVSLNAGASWLQPVVLDGSAFASSIAGSAASGRVVVTWERIDGVVAAVSKDKGATFGAQRARLTPEWLASATAFNGLHQNLFVTFTGQPALAPNPTLPSQTTGFRSQDLDVVGATVGSTSVRLEFQDFQPIADIGFVLFSSQLGNLKAPFGDTRTMGLGASPLFSTSAQLVGSGVLSAKLVNGRGAVPIVPIGAPGVVGGLTVFAVGLGYDTSVGQIVELTDVVTLDT